MEKEEKKVKVMCGDYTIWHENGVYKVYDTAYPDYEDGLCIYEGEDVESLLFAIDMRKTEYTKKHSPGANMPHNIIVLHYNWTEYGKDYMFDFDTFKRADVNINNEYPTLQDLFARMLEDMAE